jgi:TonB family protein
VDDKRADIQQIQKYLNGELDAKAMHRLEREAQDDPFLMDALEGYTHAKTSQEGSLAALQQRLQERTAAKTRRIIPWTVISVAASVVGFAIVLGVLYKGNQPGQNEKVGMNQPVKSSPRDTPAVFTDKKALPDSIIQQPQIAFNKPARIQQYSPVLRSGTNAAAPQQVDEVAVAPMDVLKKLPDSSAIEDRIMGYMATKKQDTVLGGDKVIITTNTASALTSLNSKAKGAEMAARPDKPGNSNPYVLSQAGLPANFLTGVVLDRTNGSPIPGATVKVVGKPIGTQTDMNGKFTLPNVKKDEAVSFGYLGYNSKTLGVKSGDSLKVELDANTSALSEVVVTNRDVRVGKAHPRNGWDNFNKYLRDNAVSPDGKAGTVELSITINANGNIGNIRIAKTLSPAADAKAIKLIKNGPLWSGNSNGKPEEVKVRVEFRK